MLSLGQLDVNPTSQVGPKDMGELARQCG